MLALQADTLSKKTIVNQEFHSGSQVPFVGSVAKPQKLQDSDTIFLYTHGLPYSQKTIHDSANPVFLTFPPPFAISHADSASFKESKEEPVFVKSMFTGHGLKAKTLDAKLFQSQPEGWFVILLFLAFGIFTWVQWNFSKRLQQIFRSAFLPRQTTILERDGNLFAEPIRFALSFIYLGAISYLIYKSIQVFFHFTFFPENGFLSFLAIAGIMFSYRILKTGLELLIGKIFKTEKETHAYRLNTLVFNHIIGIIAFPLLTIYFFQNSVFFLEFCISITVILVVYKFFKNVALGFSEKRYNPLYLFLYLCTLEILPLALLLKTITVVM